MTVDAREVVQYLAQLRTTQGLTQADVARRLHLNQSAVSYFEKAKHPPAFQTVLNYMAAIGAVLNIRLDADAEADVEGQEEPK
jgi:transcriptional regulator with XRE-family HTH domain